VRDFIYLKDAVDMTCQFLKSREVHGIFNIGLGVATSWNQLAQYLFDAYQKKAAISYVDMPKLLMTQYQNYTCANMQKFRTILPKTSVTCLRDAVREYVIDYLCRDSRW